MNMMLSENDDWETREDARTMQRYQEIVSDPMRAKKAKECISKSITAGKQALGAPVDNTPSRHHNPATIKKL